MPSAGTAFAIPGPFPGRVIEVHHPAAVVNQQVEQQPVADMVARGICALTGATDPVEGWRSFFAPGDVVGLKVNPTGAPHAISNYALLHEVVTGLRSAGVKPQDVIVFDRYRTHLQRAGYPGNLPEGVRWDAAADDYDRVQLGIDGYDPDVYREIDLVSARFHDPCDDRARRSHVCRIVSRAVNKIINLPVLKHHECAGVTLALKNLSHGLVNNVARSHATAATMACNTFIPAIVSLPVIRSKVVLHILDGIRAVFDRGPTADPTNVWNHATLSFATDPVALDRIGWETIDRERRSRGLAIVTEGYARYPHEQPQPTDSHCQPQHIALAAALGLGVFDRTQLNHTRIVLGGGGETPIW
jgi:uncharacterized protein (DUF362 family)